jgi:hypothetical protein
LAAAPKSAKPAKQEKNVRLNLNDLLSDDGEEENEVLEAKEEEVVAPSKTLTIEEVRKALKSYGEILSDEGKKSLPKLIESLVVSFSDNQLLITVNSKQKEGQLEEERVRISEYFRQELGQAVPIVIQIDKEESGPRKPYTDREKFEDMIQSNPQVLSLRDQLDLDIL